MDLLAQELYPAATAAIFTGRMAQAGYYRKLRQIAAYAKHSREFRGLGSFQEFCPLAM
jgi:hypothetical protein